MIKNIIFDIGNVLADFRWKEFLMEKGFDEQMAQRIGDATVNTPTWSELDRGVWSFEQLMEGFIANDPDIAEQIRAGFTNMSGMVTIRNYACEWVQNLKARGFHVYYLSNFSRKVEMECSDSLAFIPLMDGGILSYREKLVKPDEAIYRCLLERYDLQPMECVFFDDTAVNIQAANELGIHGIVFENKEQAMHDMEQIISGNKR